MYFVLHKWTSHFLLVQLDKYPENLCISLLWPKGKWLAVRKPNTGQSDCAAETKSSEVQNLMLYYHLRDYGHSDRHPYDRQKANGENKTKTTKSQTHIHVDSMIP